MKKLVLISRLALLSLSVLIYSCGGNSNSGEQSTESAATETEATEPETSAVVDPEASSDSKGVGKFTSVSLGAVDQAEATKGEAIFTSKCAACHKMSAEKLVGPGLEGVTKRRTPEWIMNMITNPEQMTKEDPVAKALFEKHLVQMTFQNVSDDETRQILEYFRANDSK